VHCEDENGERRRGGGEGQGGAGRGSRKQLACHPISPRHASGDGSAPLLPRWEKETSLEMSLHEYIDIPLEGSVSPPARVPLPAHSPLPRLYTRHTSSLASACR
jgi:hypothetical protein